MRPFVIGFVHVFVVGAVLAGSAEPTHARAIKPSFWAPSLAWSATHVVIATQGEQRDGHLTVVRSLAGDLRPGARLALPALAAFASPDTRRIWNWGKEKARSVDGRRVLLFLRRDAKGDWRPASDNGDWSISFAWLEPEGPYARTQPINPGPVVITRVAPTEAELIRDTLHALADRRALTEALAIPDPNLRIAALRTGALAASRFARFRFLEALVKRGGEPGWAAMESMLTATGFIEMHPLILTALQQSDPARLRPRLPDLLERDLEFWRSYAPPSHVRSRAASRRGPAAFHYRRTHTILVILSEHRHDEAMPAVKATLAYWAEHRARDEWLRPTRGYTIESMARRFATR